MRFASSWSDCVEYFVDSWQCYNGIALYYTETFLSQNAVQYHSIKIFFLSHCIKMRPDCSQGDMLSFTLLVGCVLPVAKGELWEGLQGSWQGDILSLPLTHLAGISEPLKNNYSRKHWKMPLGGHSQWTDHGLLQKCLFNINMCLLCNFATCYCILLHTQFMLGSVPNWFVLTYVMV